MLCVYKHIIYIYNFTKIKQRRYWIVSIHIPGDRKVIYHLFESRKNLVYVISVGLISEKIVKREEKRRKTTADRRAAACAFCENRVTRFREKRKKKNCWSGLIATWKSSWGERRRLTGPRDRSSAKEHEWGGGKKGDARVSADWMGGIARFLPNPGDLWHKFADRRQRERRDRAKGRQKRKRREMLSRRFLVNVAVKEGKEGGEKEFLRNQSSRDRELIIDQIYGIIVNQIMRF